MILKWITKTLLFLSIFIILLGSFFKIKSDYYSYLWITYLISLFILIVVSKRKILVFLTGIIATTLLLVWLVFTLDFNGGMRQNIRNSNYDIIAYMHSYKIIKRKSLLEDVIGENKSSIFFNQMSMLGLIQHFEFEVKLLEETKTTIIIDIKTTVNGRTIDTIQKVSNLPNNK